MAALETLPPFIHIETTNVCNARCTMCSYPIMERQKGYMTDELFAKVLRDCKDMGVKDVNLQFLGEPLLDRKICDRIRAAKEFAFRVQMVSNASLLDATMSSQLLASGLDELRISMDGFAKKTFEDIRVGLKFERVKQNILGFLDLSSRFNGSKPRVVMTFVGLPENKNESRQFYDFWRNKVDLVIISQAKDWAGQLPLVQLGVTYTTNLPPPPCNHLWEEMIVLYDGRVTVCCDSYDGQILVGDVKRQSLREIWVSPEYQKLRNLHREGRASEIPHCSTCKYYAIW
jgi:radical SAM protein with 4Fe4S-binding SPASM domain